MGYLCCASSETSYNTRKRKYVIHSPWILLYRIEEGRMKERKPIFSYTLLWARHLANVLLFSLVTIKWGINTMWCKKGVEFKNAKLFLGHHVSPNWWPRDLIPVWLWNRLFFPIHLLFVHVPLLKGGILPYDYSSGRQEISLKLFLGKFVCQGLCTDCVNGHLLFRASAMTQL